MLPPELEQQQEKLRRTVDDWRCRAHELLEDLSSNPYLYGSSPPAFDPHSSSFDPVHVHVEPLEHSTLPSLLQSDNADLSKFIAVLSYDCIEISRLRQHASKNLYRQLLLFGHRSNSQDVVLEGEPQKAVGQSLSLFIELHETSRRLTDVLGNLLQQLCSIFSPRDRNDRPYKSFKNVSLRTVFESLGEGLAVFLVLDEILKRNSNVKGYLSLFARMMNKVKLEPDTFGISPEDLDFLDQLVHSLVKLLDVGLFQHLLLGESSWNKILEKVRCNRKFVDACASCIYDGLLEILSRLDTRKENPFDRRKILPHVALFLFSAHVSEVPEKKLGKVIAEMLQVSPLIYVEGGIGFIVLDILKIQCPQLLVSWHTLREAAQDYIAMRNSYLQRLGEVYTRDWQTIRDSLSCWVASFQSSLHPLIEVYKSDEYLQFHLRQIIQGILLANRMRFLALSMLDLHALLEVPIKKEKFRSLCHMIILLKVVQSTFRKKGLEIIKILPHLLNLIQADIEQSLLPATVQLQVEITKAGQVGRMSFLSSLTRGGKEANTRLIDSLSAVLMSLQLLKGGGSSKRQLLLSITLDVIQSIGYLDIDFTRMKKSLSKLATVVEFQLIIEEVTNCSFLYWRKELIGDWFSIVYTDVNKFSWLQYLVDAFSDGLQLLKLGHVGEISQKLYKEEIENAVKNEAILPLCRDIETDLRLHVHSIHLKGSVHVNPTKTGVRNLSWYLQMKPLRLPSKLVAVKVLVESYLNVAFYNHTTMFSYSWKIYSEMKQLALLKYGLVLDEDFPVCDLGLEVSEIVQNISSFARNNSYNINNQIFIETSNCQDKKNFRVFGAEHVASWLATVGIKAISTAVDNSVQFLTLKITALSEVLQDSYVRSNLVKGFVMWKNDEGSVKWNPSSQAESFSATMGKVSIGDQEIKFIEQLQSIITEMGNILGLLRILEGAASHQACSTSQFKCSSRNSSSFFESGQKLDFSEAIITAGRLVDSVIEGKLRYMENNDYFWNLINSFSRNSEFIHLKDFFLIIPSLMVNLIDSKIHHKSKSLRKDHELRNQMIVDGGFIIGIAFILKVTGQEESFSRLQWFASARERLKEAILSLKDSESLHQPKGNTPAMFNFWKQSATPISAEAQKGIDKLMRYQKHLELIECELNIAKTIMSRR